MPKSYWPDKVYGRSGSQAAGNGGGAAFPRPALRAGSGHGASNPVVQERRLWWPFVAGFVAMALVGTVIGAAFVKVPSYYAFRPGSVLDSSEAIEVAGAPTYESDGNINYTTVSISEPSALDWLRAQFDDDVDLVARDEILGDRDPDENREFNQRLMESSQVAASVAALRTLGYEIPLHGVTVGAVSEDFPADDVLEVGDVIVEIEGEALDEVEVLESVMGVQEPGGEVDVVVLPLGAALDQDELAVALEDPDELEERTVGLVEDPNDDDRAIMGIQPAPKVDLEAFPVDISFQTGDVGGPSAGLSFTLALIDLLSPGDLTGGLEVAVTGSISPDGIVGSVGGTGQKAAAARQAEADLFLVPAANSDYDNAVPHAGHVEVIPVDTVEEALEALEARGGDPLTLPLG